MRNKSAPVKPPAPLARALKGNAVLSARWKALSTSHRKEYAVWIASAKQDATRARRLEKALQLLADGTKTPHRANDAPANSAAPVAKKLGVKPGQRVVVIGAPAGHEGAGPLPPGASQVREGPAEVVLAFAQDSKALARVLKPALAASDGGAVWIAFPKKSSRLRTDISRDAGWGAVHDAGWQLVSLIAIDATWAAGKIKPRP